MCLGLGGNPVLIEQILYHQISTIHISRLPVFYDQISTVHIGRLPVFYDQLNKSFPDISRVSEAYK